MERWLPVVGYEEYYLVSDLGHVQSLRTGRMLSIFITAQGYPAVAFKINGRSMVKTVHTLVMTTFVGPRPLGHVVRHGPNGKLDSGLGNLSYGTYAENSADMVREGHAGKYQASKTRCKNGHDFTPENTYRSPNRNERQCRKCRSAATRRYVLKSKGAQ